MDNIRFKDLFSFSKRERRGIFILVAILFALILLRINLHVFVSSNKGLIDNRFREEVKVFLDSREKQKTQIEKPVEQVDFRGLKKAPARLFHFDPNTVSDQQWEQLGLNAKQIQVINNYKKSGGKFFNKADLKKIYGLDEHTYNRLKNYIKIESKIDSAAYANSSKSEKKQDISVIELNAADTFQLTLIRGIGPVFARRICKYRGLLGGFVTKDQLIEVYGITRQLVDGLDSTVSVNQQNIRQINLNQVEFGDLLRHPYLNEYQTRAIMHYRQFKGKISNIQELQTNNILDEGTYLRMRPYLTVSDKP